MMNQESANSLVYPSEQVELNDHELYTAAINHIKDGNLAEVKEYFDAYKSMINYCYIEGLNSLHIATIYKQYDIMRFLIAKSYFGDQSTEKQPDKKTSLAFAIDNEDIEAIDVLAEDANFFTTNFFSTYITKKNGQPAQVFTGIEYAIFKGNKNVIIKIDEIIKNTSNSYALNYYALLCKNATNMKLLLFVGVPYNQEKIYDEPIEYHLTDIDKPTLKFRKELVKNVICLCKSDVVFFALEDRKGTNQVFGDENTLVDFDNDHNEVKTDKGLNQASVTNIPELPTEMFQKILVDTRPNGISKTRAKTIVNELLDFSIEFEKNVPRENMIGKYLHTIDKKVAEIEANQANKWANKVYNKPNFKVRS